MMVAATTGSRKDTGAALVDDKPASQPLGEQTAEKDHFLVVGIGASAGGITALRQFFSHVTTDSGIAYVVILHLSSQHESSLAALLQVETKVPVTQVTESVRLEPDHVYVIPPGKYLGIEDGHIKLVEPERPRGAHTSIDLFFRSLANAYHKDAVGIVLSGTGADGTLGLKQIKEAGGFVMAQDPAEAEYQDMPRSAIDTGLVDLILSAAVMPGRLCSLNDGARQQPRQAEEPADEEADLQQIMEIFAVLRQHTGHDFSQYKRPTLRRRIARRMQLHLLPDTSAYMRFLHEHPDEIPALLRDLLITVTNFFRDHEAFEALEREVVPKLFAGKTAKDQVRVWVVGCATGEEAYSIAMLLCEHAARLADPPLIQILSTDIDESAIAKAREGRYPQTIALDVSPERLRQFFRSKEDNYQVKQELRDLILFAAHNVLRDPPFSKLDLISCRNLLIYLNRDTQERVLAAFHFALSPQAYLFLGASESVESASSLFVAADYKQHIYTRRPTIAQHYKTPAMPRGGVPSAKIAEVANFPGSRPPFFGELHQKIVEQLAPPSCLITEDYDIVHMSEHAGRYFRFAGGEPSHNLLTVIRPEMRLDLRAVLLEAQMGDNDHVARSRLVHLEIDGKPSAVNVSVRRARESPPEANGLFLVIFDETVETVPESNDGSAAAGVEQLGIVAHLEAELQIVRDQLYLTIEQHETSNEEFKASNEELEATNEELRSTSEELETSKEELQSLNEELTTINQELRETIEELGRTNSDLQNLMSSTDIGIIFLDRELRIKRYTTRTQELFNITANDLDRPLEHFTHKLDYQLLKEDAEVVLQTLQSREREVHSADGRWYLARLLPYRTLDDRIDGVVLSFVDITAHRQAVELRQQAEALREQSQVLELANVLIFGLDHRIILWNAGCERLYGYSKEEALGRNAHELLGTVFSQPLDTINAQLFDTGSWEGELSQAKRGGERIVVASRWVMHRDGHGEPVAILEANHDISDRKRAEDALRAADRHRGEFQAILAHELRNPLAAVLSSLELFNDADNDEDSKLLARGVMDRQLKLLIRLVNDLLDLERLARGKIALQKERIDVTQPVKAALETNRALIEEHNHTLTVSLPKAPVYIIADPQRLAQVVGNLLHNAVKYTPSGGRIEIVALIEGSQAVIRVRDNGIGIPAELLPNIFDYFAQETPSSAANRRSLGVGLALARQLVELHDGAVEAKSEGRGEGSEFIVRLPLAASTSPEMPGNPVAVKEAMKSAVNRRRVLVIDDEHDVADSFANLLRGAGHAVWTAYDGQSGIDAALEYRPDAVLVDLAMPGMDGYEVARRLHERLPGLLLIAVTGLVREADRARARAAGFAHNLAKPVTRKQIEEILAQRSRLQADSSG